MTTAVQAPGGQLDAPVRIASGTLEALKWIAVASMTADHVNKYLFGHSLPAAYEFGRLALPLFLAVLAYHLAQPGAAGGPASRTAKRLVVFGLIASVPYTGLDNSLSWWPLNVLFTMLALVLCIQAIDKGRIWAAIFVFALGGLLVEYWWPALMLGLALWQFYRRATPAAALGVLVSLAALCLINMNAWALLAVPLLLTAPHVDARLPRLKWLFYAYYPLHLVVLLLVRLANTVPAT